MDKFEYNVRANEIKELIKEGNFTRAGLVADTIDWRRVKSIMMLCTISDVYKINRRYADSREILSYAYERNPNGRLILYYLCELSIKLDDIVAALEYYKRFAQIAPKDASQLILLYKIYEAQDATLEERIAILEKLKKQEYKEKWAFELAYLYHMTGQTSLSIAECDEIFLWFGKGKYVTRALQLKQLHVELPENQLQRLEESLNADTEMILDDIEGVDFYIDNEDDEINDGDVAASDEVIYSSEDMTEPDLRAADFDEDQEEDMDIRIRPLDISQFSTINLQQEIAEGMKKILSTSDSQDTKVLALEEMRAEIRRKAKEIVAKDEQESEDDPQTVGAGGIHGNDPNAQEIRGKGANEKSVHDLQAAYDALELILEQENAEKQSTEAAEKTASQEKSPLSETGVIRSMSKVSGYDEMLSQDFDGQISLVLPEESKIEKQITGQLKIDDILSEWERQKRDIAAKRHAEIRRKIQEQTENLFDEFDENTRIGLLEKLEKAMVDAVTKGGPSVIKVTDISNGNLEKADGEVELTPEGELALENELDNINDIVERAMQDKLDIVIEEESDTGTAQAEPTDMSDTDEVAKAQATDEATAATGVTLGVTANIPGVKPGDTVRELTNEEKARFGRFVQHKRVRRQLIGIIDSIKQNDKPHHIIISGDEALANMKVVKGFIKEAKEKNKELYSRVFKVSGDTLSKKEVSVAFAHLTSGIVIIEQAGEIKEKTAAELQAILANADNKLMIIMEDSRAAVNELLNKNAELEKTIPYRIDLSALDNQSLVEYAKNYAHEEEYSIDDFGVLALHTRIAEMQTADHEVTTAEVEEIVEEAMYYADRISPKHFFDILGGKRYDKEDMIILRERDFLRH
ncbi:MAG: hypothetical protein LBC96_04860 [Lachnospiraceae bacterium]|jgi:tetratricopeptide (TPR) repeat protein|nr:hypothetical protein [Lachnospiraceae bacterium]